MKLRRIILVIGLAIVAGVFESTALTLLPWPLTAIRPILPLIVFFIVMERSPEAVLFAGMSGAVLDLFALERSGFAVGRLILIALLLSFLAVSILTNRSVYSAIALVWFGRSVEWGWLGLQSRIPPYSTNAIALAPGWRDVGFSMGFDLLLATVLFLCGILLFRRFSVRSQDAVSYG